MHFFPDLRTGSLAEASPVPGRKEQTVAVRCCPAKATVIQHIGLLFLAHLCADFRNNPEIKMRLAATRIPAGLPDLDETALKFVVTELCSEPLADRRQSTLAWQWIR